MKAATRCRARREWIRPVPVPVTPPSPTIAVETLVEEKNRDKNKATTQPQLHCRPRPT